MQEFDKSSGGCPEFESHIILYAADELEGREKDALEEHLDECKRCFAALDAERQLIEVVAQGKLEPTPALLSGCRNRFEDSLDEMDHRSIWKRWSEAFFPAHWLAMYPAASVAALLVIGFGVGMAVPWRSQVQNVTSPTRTAGMLGSTGLDTQALQSANVSGINWTPSSDSSQPPQIVIQLNTQRPLTVQGTVDDSDVKRFLLYVLHNSHRFCPDVRINAVELLRARASDPDVEKAFSQAVLTDHNPAVRLKALEALTSGKPDDTSIQTMLTALTKDANIGVRVEAINALRAISEQGGLSVDQNAMNVLRETMQKDPNTYIRLQSAAAIQQAPANQP
ncbi:MAG TPA: HEAT repeat domain-containing protein [Candidatus Acidoferrales bacterium]|nr:HEAT repeat domain-containing protein [Candidatus Acidoferrales bacterium]